MLNRLNKYFITAYPNSYKLYAIGLLLIFINFSTFAQTNIRQDISLDQDWVSVVDDNNREAYPGFETLNYKTTNWQPVSVPHNWDQYEGYRRLMHGNRHGYAWYRKTFTVKPQPQGKRYFLFFEGVGSYATVWLNGKKVGFHAGGRTTFTLDVTEAILNNNQTNILAVRADHPAMIQDLPWVCGGCSTERGFSEGSQPLGIFRPVHLIITDEVRIEPFGVHIWNDTTVNTKSAQVYLNTEFKNYGSKARQITLVSRLLDRSGKKVVEVKNKATLSPGAGTTLRQNPPVLRNPHLWSLEDPYLYTLVSEIIEKGKVLDRHSTPYGIRWISWPIGNKAHTKTFLLNGKPVFINGIAEYEHLIGQSHAFSAEQVKSRVMQMKAAGFNAFRDAHQPHNLRYQEYWDSQGWLWWTQLSAHIWYDTPAFRQNFKALLTDWVKERRNSPSVVLWGLENESKLPEDFARECTELIRKLDPTASSQRKVTTCNGGSGTDWDVPQNWTGTYGGDPATYDQDVQRQVLVGEYGAWRTLGLHTEGPFVANGPVSEDRMTQLMETKVRLAESVKDKTAGHFFWLFTSHDNPGRVQGGEGYRELDRVGPVNYKGLLTPWEEPADVYYMFRSHYALPEKEPMVYIASHTWPDRWLQPGRKDSLTIYSNCNEVELFNDVNNVSLGRKTRGGIGTSFRWDDVQINYNVLYAVGYVKGKPVARDYIVLHHLPPAPHVSQLIKDAKPLLNPQPGYNYLYRVNCGGPTYTDKNGQTWLADRAQNNNQSWGSRSWTQDFDNLPAFFASQRRTYDPISGTTDGELFQTFRYGRNKLNFSFPVPDGEYLVELYFTEPWLGTGGGMDCSGWRLFDVAINNQTVLKDVDIWREVGHDVALKKTVKAQVKGGQLIISFPRVAAGQALISGIAIASTNASLKPVPAAPAFIQNLKVTDAKTAAQWALQDWLDTGYKTYANANVTYSALPPTLFGAQYLTLPRNASATNTNIATFETTTETDVFICLDKRLTKLPGWLQGYENTNTLVQTDAANGRNYSVYRQRFPKGKQVTLGPNGTLTNGQPEMYLVMFNEATNMQPAYDLKAVTRYTAKEARFSGVAVGKETVNNKEAVVFKKAGANTIEWTIPVGVADIYAFEIRYHNPTNQNFTGKLALVAADGTVMKEEPVEFNFTRPGKWNYINTNSGTMINAGNYKIRITSSDAVGLSFNDVAVQ